MNSKILLSNNWLKLYIVHCNAYRQMEKSIFDNEFITNIFFRELMLFEIYKILIDGFTSSIIELAILQKLDNK